MNSPRRLAAAMVGVALLLGATACQTSTPDPQGSTMQTQKMPDLPDDPSTATAVVRKMMMNEAIVLLKASGLKYTDAQFMVIIHTDEHTRSGDLQLGFEGTDADMKAMTDAIWAHGWKQGSISHGVHVRKGPLDIQWGKGGGGGYLLWMTTDDVSQHLEYSNDVTRVPELAAFKAKSNLRSSGPDVGTGPGGSMTQADWDNKYGVIVI